MIQSLRTYLQPPASPQLLTFLGRPQGSAAYGNQGWVVDFLSKAYQSSFCCSRHSLPSSTILLSVPVKVLGTTTTSMRVCVCVCVCVCVALLCISFGEVSVSIIYPFCGILRVLCIFLNVTPFQLYIVQFCLLNCVFIVFNLVKHSFIMLCVCVCV